MSKILLTYSGPVLVMVIEKTNAIADWRALIGPTDAGKAKVSHPNRFSCSYFVISPARKINNYISFY